MKRQAGLIVLTASAALATSLVLAILGHGPWGSFFNQDPAGWKVPAVQVLLPLLLWLAANGAALALKGKFLARKWLALVPAGFILHRILLVYISYFPIYGFYRLTLLPLAWVGYRRFAGRASAGFLTVAGVLFVGLLGLYPYPWAWVPHDYAGVRYAAMFICFILPHAVALAGWWRGKKNTAWRGIAVFLSLLVLEAAPLSIRILPWLHPMVLPEALALAALAVLAWQAMELARSVASWKMPLRLLAAALVGIIVATAALALPETVVDPELSAEEEIYAAIFLHGIRYDRPAYIYVDDWKRDPSPELLAALANSNFQVYGISRAHRSITGVRDKLTLCRGAEYGVRNLEWLGADRVQAELFYFYTGLAAAGYRVELVRTSRGWQVVKKELDWIS